MSTAFPQAQPPPIPEASPTVDAEDIARAFLDIYRLGRNTVVEEIVLRPRLGDL